MINPIINKIKETAKYREENGVSEKDFIRALEKYFDDKYHINITAYVWGKTFGFEKSMRAYGSWGTHRDTEYMKRTRDFDINIDVLYKFCKDFDAEFLYTTCDGDRYVFSFKNININRAFW